MQNSVVIATFSVLEWENLFGANLVQKTKIVPLNWNLVPRLIRICRIQWCGSFYVLDLKYHFLANLVQKIKIPCLSWNLVLRLIRNLNLFPIPDFGVSMAILNLLDISCRWCKLNFRPKWGQLKSCHFSERIGVRWQYFHFL